MPPSTTDTTKQRQHKEWLFGLGVAVELYDDPGERPHISLRFDEYDPGCYFGDEFSMLAHSAHVDPARHLSPDTLRLVTVKLEDEPSTEGH